MRRILFRILLLFLSFSPIACASYKSIKIKETIPRDESIIESANRIITIDNITITEKKIIPPSGDKRDYITMSPYRWPNPNTENGLPYIFRDGEINPESKQYSDLRNLNRMIEYINTLSEAYSMTGNGIYVKRAAEYVRAFFLDEKTGMNPNLYYAQFIPGISNYQSSGIIEIGNLPHLLEDVETLSMSYDWPRSVSRGLKKWMSEFYEWMITSEQGIAERNNPANIGTAYDYECLSILKFLGRKKEINKFVNNYTIPRLEKSVREDGGQSSELMRAISFTYSCDNIYTWIIIADLLEKYGIDLWNYSKNNQVYFKSMIDFLLPYASGVKQWEWKQIHPAKGSRINKALERAAIKYNDNSYNEYEKNTERVEILNNH